MTSQKDLKRLVRARMRKTGESYTAARARILARAPVKAPQPKPSVALELARQAGMSDDAVRAKTGKDWAGWVAELDRAGGVARPHRELARWLASEHGLGAWWAQTVTVGYERIRGRRVTGQRSDGTFQVSKSKTFAVSLEALWRAFGRCEGWLGADQTKLRMSKATRLKSMRMKWEDGTPVNVNFFEKGPTRSQLQLQHEGLASRADVERLRAYWGARLGELARVLAQD